MKIHCLAPFGKKFLPFEKLSLRNGNKELHIYDTIIEEQNRSYVSTVVSIFGMHDERSNQKPLSQDDWSEEQQATIEVLPLVKEQFMKYKAMCSF